ncbi:GNAT family N-acetyltransferase [Mucilaginibacter terrae]|uniref:Ribosomal protein S18 acetylase RimI-like enzyme n=1 Tax=Mucilaginibacter terrae TaxID=1955052 RepID=A0ABU3GPN7_9SPHI|nr:GNAT family N-acetyltransferase [Mucilaginibacter terrae]MDT3401748.1 ribosomal protein S18 acetylase RimI-like enzyme [Mucilaginibacter terrae]
MRIKRIDVDEIGLVSNLFNQYRVFYKQPSDEAASSSFLLQRLSNNESVIFVALDETDKPVGFTQLYPKYSSARLTKNWILNDLYVAQDHRKKGIGEQLIKTAMEFGKQTGATFIQLETQKENYTAQSLYKAIGFEQQVLTDDFLLFKITI